MRRWRRWLFPALLAGAIFTAAWWAWERATSAAVEVGDMTVHAELSLPRTHWAGPFRIHVERLDEGVVLAVTHRADPRRRLWASVPGRAFVGAALGTETVTMSRGHVRVRDRIRLRLPEQTLARIDEDEGEVAVTGEVRSRDASRRAGYRLSFRALAEDRLGFELRFDDPELNRAYLHYASVPAERFYGFGMQFSHLDMKGRRLPVFIGEQGVGRGLQPLTLAANLREGAGGSWHSSYAAVPHYLTSELRSLFLETYEYAVFDLRAEQRATVELYSGVMRGQLLYGATPRALIRAYTDFAGRMPPLPDWVHRGAIVGLQGGGARVRDELGRLRAHGVPLAGVWVQDWVGHRRTSFGDRLWWNWQLDRTRYPDWDALVEELAAEGIRVLTYLNPYLTDDVGDHVHDRDLFEEARAAGYLVRDPRGEVYRLDQGGFHAALVDLTDPAARAWLRSVVKENVLGVGASGWMADFGEGLPYDAVLHGGESGAQLHNRYAEEWAAFNREVLAEAGLVGEAVVFHRSGYTRSPGHAPLFWLGDQLVSWDRHDGIKTAVIGLLSSGFSGFALNHGDTGGYTSITDGPFAYRRSAELFKRWAELSAFTSVLRTHEGNRPAENHQLYDAPDTMRHFAEMATLYAAMADYRRELVQEASQSGLPVVRHPFLHYPDDPQVLDLAHQFMLGPDLMVAPVLDRGRDAVSLYLPAGRWVHLWSDEVHGAPRGEWTEVPAPIGEPAVFYRQGTEVGESLRAARATRTR